MQYLETKIQIPSEYVLMKKVDYNRLVNKEDPFEFTMADLEKLWNRKRDWIKKNVFEVPYYRRKLDEFSTFPTSKGGEYRFQSKKMRAFLDKYGQEILKKSSSEEK